MDAALGVGCGILLSLYRKKHTAENNFCDDDDDDEGLSAAYQLQVRAA